MRAPGAPPPIEEEGQLSLPLFVHPLAAASDGNGQASVPNKVLWLEVATSLVIHVILVGLPAHCMSYVACPL